MKLTYFGMVTYGGLAYDGCRVSIDKEMKA